MNETPPRPFYKRKRWIAAGLIWLVLAYPLSSGPAAYAIRLGWIDPTGGVVAFWSPQAPACYWTGGIDHYADWSRWWSRLAIRHSESL